MGHNVLGDEIKLTPTLALIEHLLALAWPLLWPHDLVLVAHEEHLVKRFGENVARIEQRVDWPDQHRAVLALVADVGLGNPVMFGCCVVDGLRALLEHPNVVSEHTCGQRAWASSNPQACGAPTPPL